LPWRALCYTAIRRESTNLNSIEKMKQLYDRVFKPIRPDSLIKTEKRRALEFLIFLTEKRINITGSSLTNGSTQ